jgi:branched-chain amino acid transport system substrate-binding protein
VKWNNANNTGVKLDLVGVEDDKGDPLTARAAVSQLLRQGVQAFVGDISSSLSAAEEPLIDRAHAFFVLGTSWADNLTGPKHPTVFRVGVSNTLLATHGAVPYLQHLAKGGDKSFGFLAEDSPYGRGLLAAVTKLLPKSMSVHSEIFPANSTDVSSQLLALKQASPTPQLVTIFAAEAARNLAIPQAYEVGLAPGAKLLASWNWPTSSDFWPATKQNGVGVQWVDFTLPGQKPNANAKLMAKAMGKAPSIWGAWAWDATMALANAAAKAKSVQESKLLAAMKTESFTGATGPIHFSGAASSYHNRTNIPMYILTYTKQNAPISAAKLVYGTR